MEVEIEYLKKKYPDAQVWKSLDKDFICIRHTDPKAAKFYRTEIVKGKEVDIPFNVNITRTVYLHRDTIRIEMFVDGYPLITATQK